MKHLQGSKLQIGIAVTVALLAASCVSQRASDEELIRELETELEHEKNDAETETETNQSEAETP